MKVLQINGADVEGGAAKAAVRLLQGLQSQAVEARLLVQRKHGQHPLVDGPTSPLARAFESVRPTVEQLLLGTTPGKVKGPFAPAYLPDRIRAKVAGMAPDIVHLHWVARMMRLETLGRLAPPLVWTLHDSWPFTGGCYLPLDCTRYRDSCGSCPVLGSSAGNDLSRRVWQRKQKAWRDLNLTIIAPSNWMADRARASSLFCDRRIEVIPNGLDTRVFRSTDQRLARATLSLDPGKKFILFGAKGATSDPNKGLHLLKAALRGLNGGKGASPFELLVFGSSAPAAGSGVETRYLGWQDDDARLALLYAAADLFVLPSIQENLPFTVMEAMACGTPCVAFDQGGVPDLIDHEQNGYLARPHDPADLAKGIALLLEHDDLRHAWGGNARLKVEREFDMAKVCDRHLNLYREILAHG